jgi:GT2 family glycosyltransferase
MGDPSARVTLVLLTYNCAHRLDPILDELESLELPIVAVDNASSDNTLAVLGRRANIEIVALPSNIGAAARNEGLRHARTPYLAFCDDDGYYERDGLQRAADALDRHPRLALVSARILVGEQRLLDPISAEMAGSPLPETAGIPGAVLIGFMAGACVVRVAAYQAVGGYDPEFFIGGEEETLALKLVTAGWQLRYLDDVVVHHRPSLANAAGLAAYRVRNALWCRWLYRRAGSALIATVELLRERPLNRDLLRGTAMAVRGLPWVMRHRRAVPLELDRQLRTLDRHHRSLAHLHRLHAVHAAAPANCER